jgi:hypothetical protein
MSQATKEKVLAELAARKAEFQEINEARRILGATDTVQTNPRLGVGVALEITVKLLAPELFEEVLAVIQGRA